MLISLQSRFRARCDWHDVVWRISGLRTHIRSHTGGGKKGPKKRKDKKIEDIKIMKSELQIINEDKLINSILNKNEKY